MVSSYGKVKDGVTLKGVVSSEGKVKGGVMLRVVAFCQSKPNTKISAKVKEVQD